jgi:hypothetical protein
MGLDMYAFSVPSTKVPTDKMFDVRLPEGDEVEEIQYWRKHAYLHGWMHRLYNEKGGFGAPFNCTTVRLLPEDLDRLENDIQERILPKTEGFFFGNYPPTIETDSQDLDFVQAARKEIEKGNAVFYYPSW